jgi:hypothetical protein
MLLYLHSLFCLVRLEGRGLVRLEGRGLVRLEGRDLF